MTLHRPIFMQAASGDPDLEYSAQDTRSLLDALLVAEGVVGDNFTLEGSGGGLAVTQRGAGASMSVDVAAGKCFITGDDVTAQGKYLCVSDATVNVTVPAAPGSGTRVHRVIARVKDKLHNGAWSTYEWTPDLLTDTGSGTPALPASAITLATVSVTVGQVSVLNQHITMARPQARVTSAAASTWQSWTPVAATAGSAITLGTGGSATGRFQVVDGKACHFTAKIIFGSNASFPSNTDPLGLFLPRTEVNSGLHTIVVAHASSGGTLLNGVGLIPGTAGGQIDRFRFDVGASSGNVPNSDFDDPWSSTGASPANWRSKTLYVSGTYEIA